MCIVESKWIMNWAVASTLIIVSIGHLALNLYFMHKSNLIKFDQMSIRISTEKRYKEYIRYLDEDQKMSFILRNIFWSLYHIIDVISDWLYIFMVPSYS